MLSTNSFLPLVRRVCAAILVGVVSLGIAQAQDEKNSTDFDPSKLCGDWKFIEGKRAGNPTADEGLIAGVTINEKDLTIEGEGGTFVMAYQLNTKKNPMEVDFQITAGPVPEGKAIGIIRLSGDKLTLCYDPTGAKRPDKFESNSENGWHLFELAKKAFDVGQLCGTWKYDSGDRAGEKVAAERLDSVVTVSKDKFIVPAGPDSNFIMAYTVDANQTPIAIDLTIESGPAPEGKAVGIIKLEKGKMTLCYDPAGLKRPADFKSTADNGCFAFVLTKQADEAEKKVEAKKTDAAVEKKQEPSK